VWGGTVAVIASEAKQSTLPFFTRNERSENHPVVPGTTGPRRHSAPSLLPAPGITGILPVKSGR
jgi:hypothetical protein